MKKLLSALAAVVLAASFALPAETPRRSSCRTPEQVKTGAVVQVKTRHHGQAGTRIATGTGGGVPGVPAVTTVAATLADMGTTAILDTTTAIVGTDGCRGYYGGYPDHYRYYRGSGATIYFNF